MTKLFLFCLLFLPFIITGVAQDRTPEELIIQKELNPSGYFEAKKMAIQQGLPVSLKLQNGTLIDVLTEQNGQLLYSVIKNSAHPFSDLEVLNFGQISNQFDLSGAEINWGVKVIDDQQERGLGTELLLIPDWTNDNVLSFSPVTGDLINGNFIPPNPGNLASPKHALLNPAGFISISDQITDLVQKFDTSGNYIGIYAPAGGVNTAILDNIRGHAYRPNGNLVVTVGSGGNQNGVPEFDSGGNYLGNFIAIGSGGLNSPFCILFRTNDVLVTASTSDAAHRYDLNGNYLNNLISGVQFPQQIVELPNTNLALCVFSTPSGLGIYDANGTQLNFFTQVTGLRGVYQLPSGNYIVTNGTGLHEIDGTNGNLIRTIHSSANMQYISYVDFSIIPVELVSFSASTSGGSVTLDWQTATETNNSGFAVERSTDNVNFSQIGFVPGAGTSTEIRNYSFTDNPVNSLKYYYRLKQIDYNGSYEYSEVVEVEIGLPTEFSLEQNYPNPFNPSTKIKYSIPQDAFVSIKVFNVLGEKVSELVNEEIKAGIQEVTFDASHLSSGIYFYLIEAKGTDAKEYFDSKKMILLK